LAGKLYLEQKSFAFLTLLSWVAVLKYLRLFNFSRTIVQFIIASIIAMVPFMVVILIMLLGFSLSAVVRNGQDMTMHNFTEAF